LLKLSIEEPEALTQVCHALSSDIRINIVRLLNDRKLNIVDIAKVLNLPVSTVASNVRVLEKAGIVITEVQSAKRGTMKICSRNFEVIQLNLNKSNKHRHPKNCYELEMPIGHYTDCHVSPTCGLLNSNGSLNPAEEPSVFYHPQRVTAGLIWFRKGYLEYKFPVLIPANANIQSVQFSMEICSEAPGYDHDWPSDITVWINNKEIGTWTCPGDFGDRRGRLNPPWLFDNHTQYGLLKNWKVDRSGSYLDDVKISDVTLDDINIKIKQSISLKIGIKPNAVNIGGLNLFGSGFGDHKQDIIMRILYE